MIPTLIAWFGSAEGAAVLTAAGTIVGYLLRHYHIAVPFLPSPPSGPSAPPAPVPTLPDLATRLLAVEQALARLFAPPTAEKIPPGVP